MKCVIIFLVLTLVVLMAEPGEAVFGSISAIVNGAKTGWKEYRYNRDMERMARKYGPNWQKGGNSQPADNGQASANSKG
ncbi:dicentracin-like [Siniperca chuatsi]|uniref:dicentracin-like n=1 Tax=Siniperca chuatsi TaxID=119488 RepID=UPI001CE2126E|nr:dicentracin-like [Siniperca chuatsi]XP_044024455.1 dicentracin-like [Siniperca chuatsi]